MCAMGIIKDHGLTHAVHLRSIISSLYMLIAQAHDYHGPNTQHAMTTEMYHALDHRGPVLCADLQ